MPEIEISTLPPTFETLGRPNLRLQHPSLAIDCHYSPKHRRPGSGRKSTGREPSDNSGGPITDNARPTNQRGSGVFLTCTPRMDITRKWHPLGAFLLR